ncbi:hypothetical protein D3C85_1762220 [compost metagenome]
MRMLTPTLWRYGSYCTFKNFKKSLLYTFTGNIACNGWVLGFTCNFINLINIDDAALCFFNIIISRLDKFEQDVFNIFPYITSFC